MQHLRPSNRVPEEVLHITDAECGLDAWLVLDSTRLGPAVGGIRTREHASSRTAREEAEALAWAMTTKCALAGLKAGGGKTVVRVHPGFDRGRAFARLGDFIQELGGRYVAGADFGTGAGDLAILAAHTEHVHINEADLTAALAVAHHACVTAALRVSEDPRLGGVSVAIQGVGSVGGAIARHLGEEGFHLLVADLNPRHLEDLEPLPHVKVLSAATLLNAPADVLAPCALGGVLTSSTVAGIQAKAVVPGANNVFHDEAAERCLDARGVLCVPDVLSSAGAVVQGIGTSLMGWERITPHLERLGSVAEEVLLEARASGRMPGLIARERALHRLERPL